jgi:hypothetical protein
VYVVENKFVDYKDVEQSKQVRKYYENVNEQLLNIVFNNFEVPLAIFVNNKIDSHSLPLSEPIIKPEAEDSNNMYVIDQEWFERNINDKFAQKKTNYIVINANLLKQTSIRTKLKEYTKSQLAKYLYSQTQTAKALKDRQLEYMLIWILSQMKKL